MIGEMKLEDRNLLFQRFLCHDENPQLTCYILGGTGGSEFEVRSVREIDSDGEFQYSVGAFDCNDTRLRLGRESTYPDTYVIVRTPEEALEAARSIYASKDQYC